MTFKATKPVLILVATIGILGYCGYNRANYEREYISSAKAAMTLEMAKENEYVMSQQLKEKDLSLRVATASARPQLLTKAEAKKMIQEVFPPSASDRFAAITTTCENGPDKNGLIHSDRKGQNAGSYDLGMSQVNSKWHEKRVEKMFGMDFDVAMSIPILNYIYAAFMYDHAGNFDAWVCDKLV